MLEVLVLAPRQTFKFLLNIEVIPFEFLDFGTPSLDQVKEFFSIIEDSYQMNLPVLVHCAMGCGRTGLLLTLYLMKYENQDWESALSDLRSIRPCAVESGSQLDFLASMNVKSL